MIEIDGLTKRYGDKTAVDRLSFVVEPGVVTGFLGPNGAGKSTTMRMIAGLDQPTTGTVRVNGKPAALMSGSASSCSITGRSHASRIARRRGAAGALGTPFMAPSLAPGIVASEPGLPDRLRNWPASESFCDARHDK